MITIVTYNSADVIRDCLRGLAGHDIIVVDNNSTDGTADIIAAGFPAVHLVHNNDNVGFGTAHNQAVALTDDEFVVLVNPDLVITSEEVIRLTDYLRENPDVGIVGPRLLDGDGQIIISARPSKTPLRVLARYFTLERYLPQTVYGPYADRLPHLTEPTDVHNVSGACMAIRREAFEQIGGFDSHFFLFAEDVDLCERMLRASWRVVYFPNVAVYHAGSTSVNRVLYISTRSYHLSPLWYFRKRGQYTSVWLLKAGFTLELLLRLFSRVMRKRFGEARIFARVIADVWAY